MLGEYLDTMAKYVPRDIYMGESTEYLEYHSRAISVNGKDSLYTIEYFALHILWMSFMQKVVFDLYIIDPNEVKRAFASDGSTMRILEDASISYDLSLIPEKKLCEICKHSDISFRPNKISNLRALIEKRDHIAHCSGVLDLDEDDIENLARQCIRYTEEIHSKIRLHALNNWHRFLKEVREQQEGYTLVHDTVIEHVSRQNYSAADIEYVLRNDLLMGTQFERIARFHLALYLEDYGVASSIESDDYKKEALEHATNDEEKSIILDEQEAYTNFKVGLVR